MIRADSNKTYYKVMEYLVEEIRLNRIKRGDKLPTERELAEALEVSRAAIRESYKILSIVGLIENRPGSGTYIKDEFDEWPEGPMAIVIKLTDATTDDVLEFRKMIEVEISTLAAERITEAEIEKLKECYGEMLNAEGEVEKSKLDKRFHYLIAKASKNSIILNAYNAMAPMIQLFTYNIRHTVLENESKDILETLHRDIYEAIISRDREKARNSMKIHMDMINKYYQ
ncbi:transcriptional regulator, GntR family [Dethiosulfatibacter aminovorans DSM 17477]|uniref:Transcriptional regulator, GntR family n=1 Tax=Dethiosulfatibacter aminovorans DSM 17477 TaxID=1121476 RepID=A0A1M6BSW1_9FIRM|nr:FadR/GntR family transcriptional regulator [Dethiosulfatibacter aminovorans]SHI51663.1 transcriptional regulator, GntR family [Dethiosulfatibacter aminovorans DSM 17477]